jgi:glycosyltransferase involved in cell wall biosynthesis
MKVVFFHRKPRPNYNYSVENLFQFIRAHFPPELDWEIKEARYYSNGLLKRLYIGLEAAFNQKGINHITGDINFIALFLRKKFTVLTILDLGLLGHPNKLIRWLLKVFWVVLPAKRAAVITTISKSTKEELLKHVNIKPTKIQVVYVPISGRFVYQSKLFNKTLPNILQIGTKPNKNVFRLVEALEGITCKLEIIGELGKELLEVLKKSNILFTHSKNLSNEEMFSKYIEADIIAFVSTYEGFGMPIIEANAIGRVVVTSNILSMPEVAGDAAHLVNPLDVSSIRQGILKVIEDDLYRVKLIANGLQNCKRFDVVDIANQYMNVYKSLVK